VTRKKQFFVAFGILAVGISAFMVLSGMKKPPAEKEKVDNTPIVAVEEIKVSPLTLEVDSYGVVKPKYETELVAQVSGQVVELSNTFVRGGFVKKGQLLARIDPNDYEAALIDAQASMATAKAALETEIAQGKVAEREWKRIANSSPTELSLRKPQLAKELARVKAAQASVLRAQRNLERTEIRAPYDAMIESRFIGLGSVVSPGFQLGKVLGTDVAEVRLPVADNQIQFLLNSGVNAEVILSSDFAGKQVQWSATIARSEGVVDDKSRMTYLVAEVTDPYGISGNSEANQTNLRFGSYVTANILGIELTKATSIPRYLVQNNRVAVLNSESKLEYVDVEIVRQDGAEVIVSNGLSDGAQIIISALDYPVDGMQLALPSDNTEEEETQNPDTQIASIKG